MKAGLKNSEKEALVQRARELFEKGISDQLIAQELGISRKTATRWALKYGFEKIPPKKKLSINEVINSLHEELKRQIEAGKLTGDSAIKLVNAIEKLSEPGRATLYLINSCELIKSAMSERIKQAPKKEKASWLNAQQKVQTITEIIIKDLKPHA